MTEVEPVVFQTPLMESLLNQLDENRRKKNNLTKGMMFFGHSASGKSSLAKQLRDALHQRGIQGIKVWDSDNALLEAYNKDKSADMRVTSIASLYQILGSTQFRVQEARLILDFFEQKSSAPLSLIALGGGAVIFLSSFCKRQWEGLTHDYVKVTLQRDPQQSLLSMIQRTQKEGRQALYQGKQHPHLGYWSQKAALRDSVYFSTTDRIYRLSY